jgi:acetyl esterase/lipase
VRAQQLDPVLLWPSGKPIPGENNFKCGPEALINSTTQYNWWRRYYNVTTPTLTPFLVSNGTAAVVIAPGGGYQHLAWDDEGLRVAQRFNEMGVSALVLKYRVPLRPDSAGFPWASVPLMDAQRAMGVARENARAWGFNASKLGFIGFSAGGHLSAHLATTYRSRLYPRQDPADDHSCRPDVSLLIYPWMLLAGNNKSSTSLSEWLNVTADTPPTFIAQNMDDTTLVKKLLLEKQNTRPQV